MLLCKAGTESNVLFAALLCSSSLPPFFLLCYYLHRECVQKNIPYHLQCKNEHKIIRSLFEENYVGDLGTTSLENLILILSFR